MVVNASADTRGIGISATIDGLPWAALHTIILLFRRLQNMSP